jgi:RNA polymerase sigma-70 factor, ECF subfamily
MGFAATDRFEPTDADLLRRTAAGDLDAFHDFYRRNAGRVIAFIRQVSHDPATVEDIAQEVFLTVWRKAGTFKPERGDALGWLYTLTRNKAVDSWRRPERREVATPVPHRPERGAGDLPLILRQALARLRPEQRQAIALAYFGDLTYEETASRLALPVGTLKSRIRVGLRAMRELLAPPAEACLD